MLLIDSSAVVRFYSKESGWESIRDYVDIANTIPLVLVEMSNALIRKVRNNGIDVDAAKELIRSYSVSVSLVNQDRYIVTAFEIAMKNSLSIYDSLFIAAAIGEGCDLVSCDERQLEVAESLGVRTIKC